MSRDGVQRHDLLFDQQIDGATKQAWLLWSTILVSGFRFRTPPSRATLEKHQSAFFIQHLKRLQPHDDRRRRYAPTALKQQQVIQSRWHANFAGERFGGQQKSASETVCLRFHHFVARVVCRALNVTMQDQMPDLVGKIEATAVPIVFVGGQKNERSPQCFTPSR